jgi:NAD-dependent deacetylase sirtuin 7
LKKYPWLWQMDRPVSKRPQLYIVNLQWTPKDENAVLKINGKCDKVMKIVMSHLGINIPNYNRIKDPIFYHAIKLQNNELSTTSQPCLEIPMTSNNEEVEEDIENIMKKDIEIEDEDDDEEEEEDNEVEITKVLPNTNKDSHLSVNLTR